MMIKINNLIKTYKTEDIETFALDQVNIEIRKGDFVAVMGPSGCGKSTLMNIVGMLDKPTDGEYIFNSISTKNVSDKDKTNLRKSNIGFIFQSFNLINELTVFENIELPLIYNNIGSKERKKMVTEVLEKLEISHRAKHYPRQLSGGQQQRVAICRAIVVKPHLILADEPTGNLDSKNGIEVMELLKELNNEGSTILMVTHSDRDAKYAHQVIKMNDGKVIN
jgi:putative ABC transport system ATP-binding protein